MPETGSPWPVPHPLAGAAWVGRRVALLGGSFNPAHDGHRTISLLALKSLGVDQVWWLVTPQNPLKAARDIAPLAARLTVARRVAMDPRIRVTALEATLGTRYAVETLAALRRRFPRTRFVWLIGADNLAQLPRWRRWTKLMATVAIAVFNRAPYAISALHGQAALRYRRDRVSVRRARSITKRSPPAWVFLPCRPHPASATAIRRAAGTGWAGASSVSFQSVSLRRISS
ncbi:putative nicotinate-nucleotide adenylyltransferase [uncultured Gammaproteobacteria bacterium]